MKLLWAIGSVVATGWAISWAATADSWWRLLIVLAVSLSGFKALNREWYAAALSLLVGAGVLFKVLLAGADQRAGVGDWPPSNRWEIWMMATWLGVGLLSLRYSLEATFAFAVTGLAFSLIWWHEMTFLHVIAEIGVVFGLAAIWRRWDGQLIGLAYDWRSESLGGVSGWLFGANRDCSVSSSSVQEESE